MGISQKGKPGAAGSQGDSLLCGRRSKETDRVHTLFPDEIPEKMWPLPVRNLLFLGKASEQKLLNQGIRTIGDLAREREANVQFWLGEKTRAQMKNEDRQEE